VRKSSRFQRVSLYFKQESKIVEIAMALKKSYFNKKEWKEVGADPKKLFFFANEEFLRFSLLS